MPVAPYEQTFWDQGELCFLAEVPALAHIGQRFEELSDSSFFYDAPENEQQQWKRLVHRLENLVEHARRGNVKPWPELQSELEHQFKECFTQARQRVQGPVHEYLETGQMPLPEYLEFILQGAETMWMLNGGLEQGLDRHSYEARTDRLIDRLRSSDYESEADRRMRARDPQRYESLNKSMSLLLDSMDDADPQTHQKMIVQQMDLFRQSPMFQQSQEGMKQMREQLESSRDSDPELYQQQIVQIEQIERFTNDPVIAMAEMAASQEAGAKSSAEQAKQERPEARSPGSLVFNCGRRDAVTREQIALFQEFLDHQERLRPGIEAALRKMHRWMEPSKPFSWPGDRALFPDNPDQSDVPLQCFRIRRVRLQPKRNGQVVLDLDTQFGHFDEHGCSILIRGGVVERYGTWDDVFGSYVPDDDDDSSYPE